jgi:hypothetical protein
MEVRRQNRKALSPSSGGDMFLRNVGGLQLQDVTTKKPALFRRGVLSDGKLIFKYCGIFAQSKNCEARETAVVSERL